MLPAIVAMIRTANPNMDNRILEYLSTKYKLSEKREGIHLSSLVYCLTRGTLDLFKQIEPTKEELLLWTLGYGLQEVLTPPDATAPVIEHHIAGYDLPLIYRPDMELKIGNLTVEVKTTRQSLKKAKVALPETWLKYIMGGCVIRGINSYELSGLYMMGNYCLHPSTLVLTSDLRWIPLANTKVGDALVGIDEHPNGSARRKLRYTTILSMGTVVLDTYIVSLSDGRSLVCSGDHKWLEVLANKYGNPIPQWTRTADLQVGSRLRQLGVTWDCLDTHEAGYLAGSLDSEGSVEGMSEKSHGLRVGYSQKDGDTFRKVLGIWTALGFPAEISDPNPVSGVRHIRTPSMDTALRILGSIRPQRLLDKTNLDGIGLPMTRSVVTVEGIIPIGKSELIGLETSTRTLIANGIVSHNSPPFPEIYSETLTFDKQELADNWKWLMERFDIYYHAVKKHEVLTPFTYCLGWECDNCRYKMTCSALDILNQQEDTNG